jgi:hypothetical protein
LRDHHRDKIVVVGPRMHRIARGTRAQHRGIQQATGGFKPLRVRRHEVAIAPSTRRPRVAGNDARAGARRARDKRSPSAPA